MSKELLFSISKKDFEIDFFSGTGAGGQHRNKHQNCVRMYHPDSGARSTGQSNRNREANLKEAFRGMVDNPVFKMWYTRKTLEMLSGETLKERIERSMHEDNLRVEGKKDGKWEIIDFYTLDPGEKRGTEVESLTGSGDND